MGFGKICWEFGDGASAIIIIIIIIIVQLIKTNRSTLYAMQHYNSLPRRAGKEKYPVT